MLCFCPVCSNLLVVDEDSISFRYSCQTCPYIWHFKRKVSNKEYPKLKEVEHIIARADTWKNVDSTEIKCPKCSHNRAYFIQLQTRSADEPMTTFYRCSNEVCSYSWRD